MRGVITTTTYLWQSESRTQRVVAQREGRSHSPATQSQGDELDKSAPAAVKGCAP